MEKFNLESILELCNYEIYCSNSLIPTMVWDMKVEALGVGCLWDLIGDINESIMMGYGDKICGNDEKKWSN